MTTPSRIRRRVTLALGAAVLAGPLAGCGFQLRGPRPFAFSNIHLGLSAHSELGATLRRRIAANGTPVVDDLAQAEVRLEILRNAPEREILTLTGAGKVREYELRHVIRFRLVGRDGAEWIAPTTIAAKREYNFDDSQVLAKEQEEALLYRDMQTDLVEQMMRRLAAANP